MRIEDADTQKPAERRASGVPSNGIRHTRSPNTTGDRVMDTEPNQDFRPAHDPAWWQEFFRPAAILHPGNSPSEAAAPVPDTEPVVAVCRFRFR